MTEKPIARKPVAVVALTALGAALIAVCSWITVPATVPFTLQTFAVFCVLCLLGGRQGTAAVAVYLLLGAVGAPVFAGFKGGIGALFGVTGGYLLGFLLAALAYWIMTALLGDRLWVRIAALIAGQILCYAFGTVWFVTVYAQSSGAISYGAALALCVWPFLLPDAAKLALAVYVSAQVKKRL